MDEEIDAIERNETWELNELPPKMKVIGIKWVYKTKCNAMDEEIDAIERNETWELTELPPKKQVIGVKWVYKTKCNAEGKIDRHKARLVVKGYK